jgi:hypothetical protein
VRVYVCVWVCVWVGGEERRSGSGAVAVAIALWFGVVVVVAVDFASGSSCRYETPPPKYNAEEGENGGPSSRLNNSQTQTPKLALLLALRRVRHNFR